MIGYKAFNKYLTCRNNFQYEIGGTYKFYGIPLDLCIDSFIINSFLSLL